MTVFMLVHVYADLPKEASKMFHRASPSTHGAAAMPSTTRKKSTSVPTKSTGTSSGNQHQYQGQCVHRAAISPVRMLIAMISISTTIITDAFRLFMPSLNHW